MQEDIDPARQEQDQSEKNLKNPEFIWSSDYLDKKQEEKDNNEIYDN